MKRITKLTLKNFKAFRSAEFDLNGHHALVYGNNGSGKSSIYWALYTLFESSGKSFAQTKKYFEDPVTEKQSLRNVDAPLTESSSVAIEWKECDPTPGMRQDQRRGSCLLSDQTNQAATLPYMAEASQGSDFVSYRLFQHFNGSNRHDVNLWPAFARDILPYYLSAQRQPPTGLRPGSPLSFTEAVEDFAIRRDNLDNERNAHPRRNFNRQESAFAQEWANFNQELKQFIAEIEAEANAYLANRATHASGVPTLTLAISYEPVGWISQNSLRELIATQPDERATLLRQHRFANIKLSVNSAREATRWHIADRPQTFLNEARLTRIAIALRLGALLTRLPKNFNVLCFDDVLVSLDMTNRLEVLDWLFSREVADENGGQISLLKRYQVIFLTHDRELYEAVYHYATNRPPARQADGKPEKWAKWVRYELYLEESGNSSNPHIVKPGGSNDNYLQQADGAFARFDYPACANYLRKFCEKQISSFLPDRLLYEVKNDAGEIKIKDLERQLNQLKVYLTSSVEMALGAAAFDPFADLTLYRRLHLNPLSHHHPQPISLPSELKAFRNSIVPALEKLKAIELIGTQPLRETFAELELPEAVTNITRIFKLRLREPLRELSGPGFLKKRSNSLCEVVGEITASGTAPVPLIGFPLNPPDLDRLHSVFDALTHLLGYSITNPSPNLEDVDIREV
ncbi:ATP-binding protein [Hymenobacter terricola]|uniref:ATP-binding protein n=1 Tax=Hymenobacter terricola TaxID=2819236 RepID=UPI001B30703F|nr:ATP-binding protein [Hymenobacter terricola]